MSIYHYVRTRFIIYIFFILSISLTISASIAQTTYYIASNGSDNNTGRSVTSPFQTLTKINTISLKPGDQLLFRRGDTFPGTLIIRQSGSVNLPITIDAYGSGSKPVLTGALPITSWVNIGGNVWQASFPGGGSTITGLYQNGNALPLGRFPNLNVPGKGYLSVKSHLGKTQIISQPGLPKTVNWTGGEVVIKSQIYILDRAQITSQIGDTLNVVNNSNYTPVDGWGYFIQNHPATLDQNGEWYYDANKKTVRLFSDQSSPNTSLITATAQSRGVDIANSTNIRIANLTITQTLNEGLSATNVSSFTLANNEVTNSGEDGINIKGLGSSILINNNHIRDVNNNGVRIEGYKSVTFQNNSLRRVGLVAGRGKSGDGQYNGFQSTADDNVLIEHNLIDSIGYNGLTFWNNTTIRQNIISNYCMTKNDGGGLYVWNHPMAPMKNIHVQSNIIYNGIGAPEGLPGLDYLGANGIMLDDCVEEVELKDNTVFNNRQWGIYLHGCSRISVLNNTVFNNTSSQFVMYHNAGHCPFRDNLVTKNIFVSKLHTQLVADYESEENSLRQYGTIDSNYYARPFDEGASILGVINYTQGGLYSLSDWQNFSGGHDRHTQQSPITYASYKNEGAGGTTLINNSFEKDSEGWFIIYSRYNNGLASQDTEAKLDGGSLQVGFVNPSGQSNSYAQAVKQVAFTKGKTYVLRFDAVATTDVTILVYLRQYGSPYKEYDRRYSVSLTPDRKSYELIFTASDSDANAVIMFQIDGEGPTFWLDNVRMQEDVPIRNNPDDFIKLIYNPTLKDSLITLTGPYRDVKNQVYRGTILLKPFTSVVLLKDTLPQLPADLSLSLTSNKRVLAVNELAKVQLRVNNQSDRSAALTRWICRLPANIQFVDSLGRPYTDNVLTGTISQLAPLSDTTFTFLVQPTSTGLFRLSAQITTATSPDPDSRPNSGTADGEDDAATIDVRVDSPLTDVRVFKSPNPTQRTLPAVAIDPSQAPVSATQADLSLQMEVSNRAPAVGTVITCTLFIANAGGRTAEGIQVMNLLPDGFEPVSLGEWTINGRSLQTTVQSIPATGVYRTSFQARVTLPGFWLNQAQISASSVSDPDSTPGNGFANGEDDEAQADGRSL